MKFIGFRTLKTAIGATLAIIIAKELGLEYSAVAGIITILSVQKTRKKSIKIAFKRIGASILALCIAAILFTTFGFMESIFGVFLLIFIPLSVRLNLEEGIVVSSVLVSHILVEKSTSLFWMKNEVGLMLIGVCVAVILNLYMPNIEEKIKEEQAFIEQNISDILIKMADSFRNGHVSLDEDELLEVLEGRIRGARKLAYISLNNNFFLEDSYYVRYMEMRKQQLEAIKGMREHFKGGFSAYEQKMMMAQFTEKVANLVYEKNTAESLLNDLNHLRDNFRKMPLPVTREEFEIRASLFEFLNDIERFLKLKNEFIKEVNAQ
ncbi:aromatic acid exporter family protein [Clostridium lundense]|uniref:aromatic acid exporter family protein n=1 Tax=Clostridium lundense TaxID=319475 RepID=UPI0004875044|nr:aromatic acid exporter family protein [Clostridium lundense]